MCNLKEIDSILELMSGVLKNPKEFIKEDGSVIRRALEDHIQQSKEEHQRSDKRL